MGFDALAALVRPNRSQRPPSWNQLPAIGRWYIAITVTLGAVAACRAATQLVEAQAPLLTALAILSFLTAFAKVMVAVPGSVSTVSFCYVIDFTTLLVLGPAAATCTAACSVWSQATFGHAGKGPRYRTLFSIAALAITVQTAGAAIAWLANGTTGMTSMLWLTALLPAAAVYFLVNSILIAVAVALTTRQHTAMVWRRHFLPLWRGHVYGFAIAVVSALALMRSTLWLLPLTVAVLALTYDRLHAYVAGLSDSMSDPMTGLPNLRYLRHQVAQEIERARRGRTPLAVLMIDVNDFKSINDTYGHRAGDSALRQIAEQLHQSIRSYDVCARYAGDEFVVVLPGCPAEEARAKAASLQQAIASRRVDCGDRRSLPVHISVGSAVYPHDGHTFDELLAVADRQMFADKEHSRRRTPAVGRRRAFEPSY